MIEARVILLIYSMHIINVIHYMVITCFVVELVKQLKIFTLQKLIS